MNRVNAMNHRLWSLVLLVALLAGVVWAGLGRVPGWVVVAPLVLLAILNVEAVIGSKARAGGPAGAAPVRATGWISLLLFHGVAIGALVAGHQAMSGHEGSARLLTSSATSGCGGGCGAGGGCGTGGCGATSGGKCGCGSGKKVTATKKPAMPPITPAERDARAAGIQKRTMTLPPSALPGIGPNARPLPPGIQPKPAVRFPKGVVPLKGEDGSQKAAGGANPGGNTAPPVSSTLPSAPASPATPPAR